MILETRHYTGLLAGSMIVALGLVTCACTQPKTAAALPDPNQAASSSQTQIAPAVLNYGPQPQVNGQRALDYTRDVTNIGPRYVSSPGHAKVEAFLKSKLKGDALEEDKFTASTPDGSFPMANYIAKFPGTKDGIVVIAGHYDTLFNRKDFVGANDGGSSTGILLELADQFRAQTKSGRRNGYSVYLVWLDGEEAFQHWTDTDSVYGSRHLAQKWKQDGTAQKIKAFILADMIGDADLNIERDDNSTAWLSDLVYQAASRYGYQSHFYARETAMEDDHIPFKNIGVPVVDLIDFDYGYDNAFWHTKEDTADKLSAKSLEIVGNVIMQTVQLIDNNR